MNNDLTEFGYVGDISELIIDIFTGCLFGDQDERKAALLRRGIEWNEFWEGKSMKLPELTPATHNPIIDAYLLKEFTKYVVAWLETDAPAKHGDFLRAKRAIDEYFAKQYIDDDIEYYGGQGFMPLSGRQRLIFSIALNWLASRQKDKRPLGAFALKIKRLADQLAKARAAAAHFPCMEQWNPGR